MLDPLHPLFSAVVDVLVHAPGATMVHLQKQLKARGHKVSVPTLYRTVGQMISSGVLVRTDGRLSFSSTWIQTLKGFAAKVHAAPAPKAAASAPAKKQTKKEVLPKVQDRSKSLLLRKIKSFMGQRTATADLIAED